MDKYCRICWNINNWITPSGVSTYVEKADSYVAKYGFGNEEWLFDFGRLLKGFNRTDPNSYRYGFLQPLGKYLSKYQGKKFSVLLYTINPQRDYLIVARIDNLYVPHLDELQWVFTKMINQGWVSQMRRDLISLRISDEPLNSARPQDIANIRFKPSDVIFYDPRPIIDNNHKLKNSSRYHPFNWDDTFPPITTSPPSLSPPKYPYEDDDPRRREHERTRAAIKGTTYTPTHTRLQNRLYENLVDTYGKGNIGYEDGFVDLKIISDASTTFIEIKTEYSVKGCIRNALGQLLEYAHYPNQENANKFLVIGSVSPNESDISYVQYLRKHYNFPIFYSQWDWDKNEIINEI